MNTDQQTPSVSDQLDIVVQRLLQTIAPTIKSALENEVTEFREDVERFRDLEAEYAQKMVDAKDQIGHRVHAQIDALVEFLSNKLSVDADEMRAVVHEAAESATALH